MMCLQVRSDVVVMNVYNGKAFTTTTVAPAIANVALQAISSNPMGLFTRNFSIS